MKATLEFDLADIDDRMAHLRCVKALSLAVVLWDIDQYLRSQTKYASDAILPEVFTCLTDTRDKLHEIMDDNNIDLDELMR